MFAKNILESYLPGNSPDMVFTSPMMCFYLCSHDPLNISVSDVPLHFLCCIMYFLDFSKEFPECHFESVRAWMEMEMERRLDFVGDYHEGELV